MELSLQQKLNKEASRRAIEACDNPTELKQLALVLLDGFYSQRAAAVWALGQSLPARSGFVTDTEPET